MTGRRLLAILPAAQVQAPGVRLPGEQSPRVAKRALVRPGASFQRTCVRWLRRGLLVDRRPARQAGARRGGEPASREASILAGSEPSPGYDHTILSHLVRERLDEGGIHR